MLPLFVAGCAYIGSLPFGIEFQQRTFALLLSQPQTRWRLWLRKNGVIATAVIAVGLGFYRVWHFVAPPLASEDPVLFGALSMLLTISSVCFWSLVARSAIGAAVFTLGSQAIALATGNFLLERMRLAITSKTEFVGTTERLADVLVFAVSVLLTAGYCGFFSYLGWKKLKHLQVAEMAGVLETGAVGLGAPGILPSWLKVRPQTSWANLLRKELFIHKPVFLMTAVFCLCWVVFLLVRWFVPDKMTANGLIGIAGLHMLVSALLAGCLCMAEEHVLGTAQWHRSLPVSWLKQWTAKLLMATLVVLVASGLVPLLLVSIGMLQYSDMGYSERAATVILQMLVICLGAFCLGTWASAFCQNTVRAVALGIGMGALLVAMINFGWKAGNAVGPRLVALVTPTLAYLQVVSTDFDRALMNWFFVSTVSVCTLLCSALVFQSRRFFRPLGTSLLTTLLGAGVVIVTVLLTVLAVAAAARWNQQQTLGGFILVTFVMWLLLHRRVGPGFFGRILGSAPWAMAVTASGAFLSAAVFSIAGSAVQSIETHSFPESGAYPAVQALAERLEPNKAPPVITVDDLTSTGRLPAYAKVWLRGARIEVRDQPGSRQVVIVLPNGKSVSMYSWSEAGRRLPPPSH